MNKKVIMIHGNGGSSPLGNWFPAVKRDLEAEGLTVIAEQFPDSDLARSSIWLPFLLNDLKADENTILIGHSTGAIAAMRAAEIRPILGSVLVGTYHTHLGIDKEKEAGYFDSPWNWEKIKNNQKWSIIFASQDDPWIPIQEARYVHQHLNSEYHEYKDQGHFGGDYIKQEFPELSQAVIRNLRGTVRIPKVR